MFGESDTREIGDFNSAGGGHDVSDVHDKTILSKIKFATILYHVYWLIASFHQELCTCGKKN
jgi:hypothetical protein